MPNFFRSLFGILLSSAFILPYPSFAKTDSISPPHRKSNLSIGIWRGEIMRPDGKPIVFNFQTKMRSGKIIIYVINGAERLLVNDVRENADSIYIHMPFYDSYFALRLVNSKYLRGDWIKNYSDHLVSMRFSAVFNISRRFPVYQAPLFNISGRWSVHFKGANDSTESVGEFTQTGSYITGTFLTITGDYRYLEGVVSGDTLKLSTFDGGHAYYFTSKILDSNKMTEGKTRYLAPWYIQNKSRSITIIGLAYERTTSFTETKRLLQPFITRFNVTYPILATGVSVNDSLRTEKTLPEIQKIIGFPTTIFIDKKGVVRKIETGFNGPGTGEHYETFKKEFNELLNTLVNE